MKARCASKARPSPPLPERQRCALRLHKLGFVFQAFNLVPVLDAVENVMLPLQLQGRSDGEARKLAAAALDRVGGTASIHLPGQLSGGQQQQVAIARAWRRSPSSSSPTSPPPAWTTPTADR
ncbi:MAG: ATP-binding cassette domain-containing protein [Holophagaceae bacterium]|nr:ATP-binding cassette domain-containing protein [Holophagaceae bacterium]